MADHPTNLDEHRGMMAQKATQERRTLADVAADQAALKERQTAIETMFAAMPAATWAEAAEKARHLLTVLAASPAGEDPRRRTLITETLADFDRLLADETSQAPD